jgi:hypothetical protein
MLSETKIFAAALVVLKQIKVGKTQSSSHIGFYLLPIASLHFLT